MGRGFLMALLALDLLVMGTSGVVLWDRLKGNFFHAPAPPVVSPHPTALQPAPESPPAVKTEETEPPIDRIEEKMPEKKAKPLQTKAKISFSYRDPFAKRVSIVGDFNRWSPQLMKKDASHKWSITLTLKPGDYAYNFAVDGKLIRDPARKQSKKRAGQKIPTSLLTVK